jgi:hypothetical protein
MSEHFKQKRVIIIYGGDKMTKQEIFLNECQLEQKKKIIVVNENNINDLLDELGIERIHSFYEIDVEDFYRRCKGKGIKFKNACLDIDRFGGISLSDNSIILKGIFDKVIFLEDKSGIDEGVFNNNVILYDYSYIKGGIFNDKIDLYNNSKIINARFGGKCKVFIFKSWKKDEQTLNILNKNNIQPKYLDD